MKLLKEFKEFAMRGNVVDMAVGVIIGAAFGKIVTSLVNDIIMPGIGVLTGGANFSEFKFVLKDATTDAATGELIPEVAITWGAFVQTIVDFLIIAFSIFVALRYTMKFMHKEAKEEAAPAPAPEPTAEEKLLTEIRDLLKEQKK